MHVRSDRSYRLEADPDELWHAFSRLDLYRHWWPWLRRFDATSITAGERWSCVVQPPLPYSVRFDLLLEEVDAPRTATASLTGDIQGHARLLIAPSGDGSELRLVSHLAPSSRLLRAFARLAPPAVHFGHDWVLDTGFRQFTAAALARR